MKLKSILFMFMGTLLLLFFTGCDTTDDVDPTLSLPSLSITLQIDETLKLNPTIKGSSVILEINYVSKDESIVSVDRNGNLKALKAGETTIEVTLANYPSSLLVVKIIIEESSNTKELSITGPESISVGESIEYIATNPFSEENWVFWESKTPETLRVSQNGVVRGLKEGTGIIRITGEDESQWVEKTINVVAPLPEEVIIQDLGNRRISYLSDITLTANVLPEGASQKVTWLSYDEDICDVDENGKLIPKFPGEVVIMAIADDTTVHGEITVKVEPTLMEVMEYYHNPEPFVQNIQTFGAQTFNEILYQSVNDYLNIDLDIIESIISASLPNRTNEKQTSTIYITVHDTGNNSVGAGASAHNNFIHGGGGGENVSWHYTVGNDGIYQHLPMDETARHAADGMTVPHERYDSGIAYSIKKKPAVTISTDGFYVLDGQKSLVPVPRKTDGSVPLSSQIVDLGIEVVKGENGNWWIGNTYWNASAGLISNRGGNLHSVGIETCVDKDSDVFLTWQMTAKLVAMLMEETGLGLDRIVQHSYFCGKDCPMTMRHAGRFNTFLRLVEVEFITRTMFKDYSINLISHNPDYIDNRGRIIDLPSELTNASYTIEITNNVTNQYQSKTFNVLLPKK